MWRSEVVCERESVCMREIEREGVIKRGTFSNIYAFLGSHILEQRSGNNNNNSRRRREEKEELSKNCPNEENIYCLSFCRLF